MAAACELRRQLVDSRDPTASRGIYKNTDALIKAIKHVRSELVIKLEFLSTHKSDAALEVCDHNP